MRLTIAISRKRSFCQASRRAAATAGRGITVSLEPGILVMFSHCLNQDSVPAFPGNALQGATYVPGGAAVLHGRVQNNRSTDEQLLLANDLPLSARRRRGRGRGR